MSRRSSVKAPSFAALAAAGALLFAVGASAGCDQLQARRKIQHGNKLYNEGRYAEAADIYEEALKLAPEIAIGQHNAALANFRAFTPSDDAKTDTKANKTYAERAGLHFEAYLATAPDDRRMIELMTTLWLDSGQFPRALEYWTAELAKNPSDRDVLRQMAGINLKGGKQDEAIGWINKRCDLEEKAEGKVECFLDIAKIQWSRLRKSDLVNLDRLRVADVGLGALQKAEALDPKNPMVQSYLGSLYELRKLTHGASWSQTVNAASERLYKLKFIELQNQAQKAPPAKADGATAEGK